MRRKKVGLEARGESSMLEMDDVRGRGGRGLEGGVEDEEEEEGRGH